MNLKKIIIILTILLIILLIIVAALILNISASDKYKATPESDIPTIEIDSKIKRVNVRNNFYSVKTCINTFYTYYAAIFNMENYYEITEENQNDINIAKSQNIEAVYNMLDTEYIDYKNITKENLLSKLTKIAPSTINISNMYVSEKTTTMSVYIVQGTLRDNKTGNITPFRIFVKIDSFNRTFSIILNDYISEKYKELEIGKNIDIQVQEKIENKINNTYTFKNISDETYVADLFSKYKEEVLYNVEQAYNNLNEEYKNKRFGNIENFKIYVKNNIEKYQKAKIKEYQKTKQNSGTQYTCIDENGNYYIYNETEVMNYKMILDTYTLNLPEFIQKYEALAENEKILYNIQKIFEAINLEDYKYVYGKLDNSFKATYFKTQQEFEKYIKENLYRINKISYGNYQKNEDIYIYNIQIANAMNEQSKKLNKKIVMKLQGTTDFVMSFNIE